MPAVTKPHWLPQRMQSWGDKPGLVWGNEVRSFAQILSDCNEARSRLVREGIRPGDTVALCGDYSPRLCSLLLASFLNRNIIVPLTSATVSRWPQLMDLAQVRFAIVFENDDAYRITAFERGVTHPLLRQLQERETPGLILFSSGSTGESKASVLDLNRLLAKFETPRPAHNTLLFLLLDHIGGINTLLYGLSNGSTVVTTHERNPHAVCIAIEAHSVELLPTTPTFLRMLLMSDAIPQHDLSSLQIISYGTEPMPQSTLAAIREALPWVRMKQTYGLSELGILPTRSRDSGSVWLKLGDRGYEHKIVDNVLWIRSPSAMLGYLNAASPFDAEGWFNTQDFVETDGEYLRIIGRKSEFINVGGEKVHPTEVENILLQIDNIREVTVRGRPNPVTGEIVAATITTLVPEDPDTLKRRIRHFCQSRLQRYQIPAVIEIVAGSHHSSRFKKSRGRETVQHATVSGGPRAGPAWGR
jgi:acyl-CoA synthetase (AMP-forming)/AMP-acid ligase II